MSDLTQLIGLKVVAIKTYCNDERRKHGFEPEYIVFDDNETYLYLEDQDYYSYHDCDPCSRLMYVSKNKVMWKELINNPHYRDSDMNIGY